MSIEYQVFAGNARSLEKRVSELCRKFNRSNDEVRILAVTKAHGPETVEFAYRYGMTAVGRTVQEAVEKKKQVKSSVKWELIGHLQSNKVRSAVATFDRIQSVDRAKLARALNRVCLESGRTLPILLEVNAGDDPAKFGVSCEQAPELVEKILESECLNLEGLMTIAPWDNDPDVSRRAFSRLRDLRDNLQEKFSVPLPELSMGMTDDLAQAIEAGSTLIRVGTALFGRREVKQWRPR